MAHTYVGLQFQGSVTFRDVAVAFSQQEWESESCSEALAQGCDVGEL